MMGESTARLPFEFAFLPLLILAPLLVVVGAQRGEHPARTLLAISGVAYACALLALTFFPFPLPPWGDPGPVSDYRGLPYPWVSPVPFETIRNSLRVCCDGSATRYLFGNVVAFVPLGLLLPLWWPRRHSWAVMLAVAVTVSAGIEIGQLAASLAMGFPFRVADVDDVILNVTGVLLGYAIFRGAAWALRDLPESAVVR